jgi:hypothetical protein
MTRYSIPLILQCLIFLIPLNIYMWGDWLLVNVQWALFRYQQSPYGNSLILGYKDILYMYSGQNTGIFNIAAASLWTIGSIILIIGLFITIFTCKKGKSYLLKTASYFTICGGIFLGLSALCRFYSGFSVPIGVPVIFFIGWWMYTGMDKSDDNDNEKEEETASEPE